MSIPIPVIIKNVLVKYHLLGLLIIINYLFISLPAEICKEASLILGMTGLVVICASSFFYYKDFLGNSHPVTTKNQSLHFIFNLFFYIGTVFAIFLIEGYFLQYPLSIAIKSGIAVIAVGFYIAASIAIEIDYARIKNTENAAHLFNPVELVPARIKLRYFLLSLFGVNASIFALLCLQNFQLPVSRQSFHEILFVATVVASLSIYLFYLYHRNFIHIVGIQVNALRCIDEENFNISIPVISDDELALLATYHNTMLERLRDRNRLYRTLEKSVGANIMDKLLNTDAQTLKQGQVYSVAILFCDLRGFTRLGESASAEEVILFLNDYFADVSSVVSRYHGIINKFMGDAVLAIFGLENSDNAVEDAVNASLAIIRHNVDFYMPNEMHPETGVGIDFGAVVGGTIGSDERYEYTIIGDAVNKASRLEGLSKRLDYSIILSESAYQQLSLETRQQFEDLGTHRVRGRQEPIQVYGCGKKSKPTNG